MPNTRSVLERMLPSICEMCEEAHQLQALARVSALRTHRRANNVQLALDERKDRNDEFDSIAKSGVEETACRTKQSRSNDGELLEATASETALRIDQEAHRMYLRPVKKLVS